jgi:hypothetical protein
MFKSIVKYFRNKGEFPKRIKTRHNVFWNDPLAEDIRNSKMSADDSFDKWKNVQYWQRKLSNKYNAREFAKKNGCQVPDLYWKGTDVERIDFSSFPEQYVIRPTTGHSAQQVFLMKNGINLFDKQQYSTSEIVNILKASLDKDSSKEFLIEEFLKNENGEHAIPKDYKFFCFNGQIAACYLITRLSPKTGFANFYDEDWKKMKKLHVSYPLKEDEAPPKCYQEMVAQAKQLSKEYQIFVRLDFYATDRGPVFGEFTPTPSTGNNFTSYGKMLMIKHWDKYCKGLV